MKVSERINGAIRRLTTWGLHPRTLRYLLASAFASPGTPLTLKAGRHLPPLHIRKGTSDAELFEEVIIRRDYGIDYGFTPEYIVDCGANVGYATAWFKSRFPAAKVVCVEPESSNFGMLLKNTAGYDDVHPVQAGIWWHKASLVIDNEQKAHCAFQVREAAPGQRADVEAISIADIIERFALPRIDILKMDIEGSEKEVFSQGFEQWLPKVRVLIVELHDRMRSGCSRALFSALQGYDYSTEVSGENIAIFFNKQ